MTDLKALGHDVLSRQPFSTLVGTTLTAFERGRAELTIPVRPELTQQHGFVHGGVVSYAADNALTFAGGSVLGDSVTAELKVSYLRPAVGETLVARATVVSSTKSQAVCRCDVFVMRDGAEVMCATALGTIRKVEPHPK